VFFFHIAYFEVCTLLEHSRVVVNPQPRFLATEMYLSMSLEAYNDFVAAVVSLVLAKFKQE